jgi:hypothetical protein
MACEPPPEVRCLSPRARQLHVDDPKAETDGSRPVKLQQPAAHVAALRTDGYLVKKVAILDLCAIQSEQLLQGLCVEMVMLHNGLTSQKSSFP